MGRTRLGTIAMVVILASAFPLGAEARRPLRLVPELDLARYSGTWYEIARLPQFFERDLVGVTATYTPRPDGKIDVINAGYRGELGGKRSEAKAIGYRPDESRPGALKVRFFGPFGADYLVFGLDAKGYSWALVGDDSRKNLWFLSRTPRVAPELMAQMRRLAEEQGFDLAKLIEVPQP